jgi:hypothetical protein
MMGAGADDVRVDRNMMGAGADDVRVDRNMMGIRFSSDQQLLANISAHMPAGTSLTVDGVPRTADDIKAVFKQRADVTANVDVKKADFHKAVEEERAALTATDDVAGKIREGLLVMFGASPTVLADLGLAPRKKRKALTGQEMVAKAAKAKATHARKHGAPAAAAPPAATPAPVPTAPVPATPPTPITPSAADAGAVNGAKGSH